MSKLRHLNQKAKQKVNHEFFLINTRNGVRHVGFDTFKEHADKPGYKGERRTIEKKQGKWQPTDSDIIFDNIES